MDARNPTPREGESAVGSIDWESLGRVLLVDEIEVRGDRLRSEWVRITEKAKKGKPVTRDDWLRLERAWRLFGFLVEYIEEATEPRE